MRQPENLLQSEIYKNRGQCMMGVPRGESKGSLRLIKL